MVKIPEEENSPDINGEGSSDTERSYEFRLTANEPRPTARLTLDLRILQRRSI